jgi:hypothetical protein
MTAAFDKMLPRRPLMTADEATSIVAEMMRDTSMRSRRKLLETAIRIGNLTDEAKAVYRAALAADVN